MTCVDSCSLHELITDETGPMCDCNNMGVISESSTPFSDVTGDIYFAQTNTMAESSSFSTTALFSAGAIVSIGATYIGYSKKIQSDDSFNRV